MEPPEKSHGHFQRCPLIPRARLIPKRRTRTNTRGNILFEEEEQQKLGTGQSKANRSRHDEHCKKGRSIASFRADVNKIPIDPLTPLIYTLGKCLPLPDPRGFNGRNGVKAKPKFSVELHWKLQFLFDGILNPDWWKGTFDETRSPRTSASTTREFFRKGTISVMMRG